MLQGQKFQAGNSRLQSLIELQNKYRADAASRSGKALETIITPYDKSISDLEEDLNDAQNEYTLHQENPMTASYKNKVKSLSGMSIPEEALEDDIETPDLETEMDNILSPKPQAPIMSEQPLSDPSEPVQQLEGNDIAPDDTQYQKTGLQNKAFDWITPEYDSDGYPLAKEGDVINKGHSVLAQNDAKIMEWNRKNKQVGATGSWEGPDPATGEPTAAEPALAEEAPPTDYMQQPEMPDYIGPPEDKEADVMLKNLNLLKTPPLKFKPDIYKSPEDEKYEPDLVPGADRITLIGKQIMDWGQFFGGKGFGERGDRQFAGEMNRLNNYRKERKADLKDLAEKNRTADLDAFQKFRYDQDVKYKMAKEDQDAAEKMNTLKFNMMKLQAQKGKQKDIFKESFKIGQNFQKLEHVKKYPGRVEAFKNAMNAPLTGSGDKDIIENLVKFIDPQGVIREGKVKFMTSALKKFSMNPDGTINADMVKRALHVGLKGGYLTPEDRKELLEATIPMMENFTSTYKNAYEQHKNLMTNYGYDPRFLMPFELAVPTPELVQAAKNKIYADYLVAKKEYIDFQKARAENPDTLGKKLLDYVPDSIKNAINPSGEKTEGVGPIAPTGEKPKGSKIDDWEKKYGI